MIIKQLNYKCINSIHKLHIANVRKQIRLHYCCALFHFPEFPSMLRVLSYSKCPTLQESTEIPSGSGAGSLMFPKNSFKQMLYLIKSLQAIVINYVI